MCETRNRWILFFFTNQSTFLAEKFLLPSGGFLDCPRASERAEAAKEGGIGREGSEIDERMRAAAAAARSAVSASLHYKDKIAIGDDLLGE